MKLPKSVTITKLIPGTVTVKVAKQLKLRLRLAWALCYLAGWVLGQKVVMETGRTTRGR